MSCESIQKRYKKKRTIANLLRTDQILINGTNEKKTYIKEYFEPPQQQQQQATSKPLEATGVGQMANLPLNAVDNTPKIDSNSSTFPSGGTQEKKIKSLVVQLPNSSLKNSKVKVKDYVMAPESTGVPVLRGNISKMNTSLQSIFKSFKPINEMGKNIQRERLSRANQKIRKSKIKDYITNESANTDDENYDKLNKTVQSNPQMNIINVPIPRLLKPKIIQINHLPVTPDLFHADKSHITTNKVIKPKRTKPKIKDYMISETPLTLTKQTKQLANKKISNMTATTNKLYLNSEANSNNPQSSKPTVGKNTNKIMNLFTKNLIKKSQFAPIGSQQAKSTIKDYLQSRIMQSKCSRAKLLKNKENLNQLKNSCSSQFLAVKN